MQPRRILLVEDERPIAENIVYALKAEHFAVKWVSKGGDAVPFVSDFFDFSIYIDAPAKVIEAWYVERFLRLRETAFRDPAAYFHRYASLDDTAARERALSIWTSINEKNLIENILPTRRRADLILTKGANHMIERVDLRKS